MGQNRWVILTKDQRIRYNEPEVIAVRQANARVFTLFGGNLQAKEMAKIFIKALPKIKRFALKHQPPFIAKITKSGNVSMLVNY